MVETKIISDELNERAFTYDEYKHLIKQLIFGNKATGAKLSSEFIESTKINCSLNICLT